MFNRQQHIMCIAARFSITRCIKVKHRLVQHTVHEKFIMSIR